MIALLFIIVALLALICRLLDKLDAQRAMTRAWQDECEAWGVRWREHMRRCRYVPR
jgi:hypothetical protein